jgi:hypothetical protein
LWNFDYFGGCSQANNPTLHTSPSLKGGACLQQAEGLVLSSHLAFFRKLKHSGSTQKPNLETPEFNPPPFSRTGNYGNPPIKARPQDGMNQAVITTGQPLSFTNLQPNV